MILLSAAGYLAMHYLGNRVYFPTGVLLGLILANLVPLKSCSTE